MGSIRATCDAEGRTVRSAIDELLVADPGRCRHDGLALLVRRSLRVRGWLDALDAAIAARAAELAADGESADAATVLGGGGRRSRRDAEAAAARGEVCSRMPVFAEALADGTVTGGHVDVVVNGTRTLDDDGKARFAAHAVTLAKAAATLPPEQFAVEVRELARNVAGDDGLSRQERMRRDRNVQRWVDRYSGMCHTKLSLDPLADAQVWAAILAAVATARAVYQRDDDRTWDQLQADAVVDLITRTGADVGREDRRVPEVSVLIDYETLLDGLHDASVCETSDGSALPVATVRRLCCEADIVPIVFGGDGELLDVGRQCRVATRAQRRALRSLYRTCAHPQCTVGFDACRIHHVVYWFAGGRSDLANLVPLCEIHHHLVHEGGWALQLFADRRTIWTTPDGTVYHDGTTTDRRPSAASDQCRRRRRPITAAEVAADVERALTDIASGAPP
jgi:hypothetical protein